MPHELIFSCTFAFVFKYNRIVKITAFVFAAGLGTRLYPLTAHKPKALVCYKGVPLLQLVIDKLIAAGIDDIVVNVHHFADMIIDYIRQHAFNARIRISDERAYLRDTGGGLKFAEPFFEQSDLLLLHNVDIISSISLSDLIQAHIRMQADVTLAVQKRESSRYLIFNQDDMKLCGWHDVVNGERIDSVVSYRPVELAFTGIHVMNRTVVERILDVEKNPIIPFYLRQASLLSIRGHLHSHDTWMDVGQYEKYAKMLI